MAYRLDLLNLAQIHPIFYVFPKEEIWLSKSSCPLVIAGGLIKNIEIQTLKSKLEAILDHRVRKNEFLPITKVPIN